MGGRVIEGSKFEVRGLRFEVPNPWLPQTSHLQPSKESTLNPSEAFSLPSVEGAFFVVSALLLVSGGSKLSDPGPTAGALRAAGLPSSRRWVYLISASEIVLGAGSIVFGGDPFGWGLAILYFGFAGFVLNARIRHLPIGSCGCFGKSDTPPTNIHLVVTVLAAAIGAWAAIYAAAPLLDVLRDQPAFGLPYLVFVGAGTYLLYLLLSELPRVGSLRLQH